MTTGAIKNDNGKPVISFIPSEYILGTAEVFTFGAKKYAAHNYRKGFAHSRPLDAALRHIFAILSGEEIDPESGLPHVYHASCSLAMFDYQRLKHPELNDIYELTKKEATCQDSTQTQTIETPKSKDSESLSADNSESSDYYKKMLTLCATPFGLYRPLTKPENKS